MKKLSFMILATILSLNPIISIKADTSQTNVQAKPQMPLLPTLQQGEWSAHNDGAPEYIGVMVFDPKTGNPLTTQFKTLFTYHNDGSITVKAWTNDQKAKYEWDYYNNGNLKEIKTNIIQPSGQSLKESWKWFQGPYFTYTNSQDPSNSQIIKFNGSNSSFPSSLYPPKGQYPNYTQPQSPNTSFGPTNTKNNDGTPKNSPIKQKVPVPPSQSEDSIQSYNAVTKETTYSAKNIVIDAPFSNKNNNTAFDVRWMYGSDGKLKQIIAVDLEDKSSNPMRFQWLFSDSGELDILKVDFYDENTNKENQLVYARATENIYQMYYKSNPSDKQLAILDTAKEDTNSSTSDLVSEPKEEYSEIEKSEPQIRYLP
jgi:hypothetical protein